MSLTQYIWSIRSGLPNFVYFVIIKLFERSFPLSFPMRKEHRTDMQSCATESKAGVDGPHRNKAEGRNE